MKVSIKSILSITWKVGAGLVGLVALFIGIMVAETWYDNTFGRCNYLDSTLSSNVVVEAYRNDRVRVWNNKTARYTTPKLRWVSGTPLRDSLTVFCDTKGRRGYINVNTGEIALRASYARAWHFSEGLAFVLRKSCDDSLSVINHFGKIVARNLVAYDPDGRDYIFADGVCEVEKERRYGLMRTDGSWAIERKYLFIQSPNSKGYRIAYDENGYWLFDADYHLVFSEPYEAIEYAYGREDGTGSIYLTKHHRKQLVNYDGSVVEPFVIDGTYTLKYMVRCVYDDFDEYELCTDICVYRVNGCEGLMDTRTGRPVTPAIYTDFSMISKDLIEAKLDGTVNAGSVVMDITGKVVKP